MSAVASAQSPGVSAADAGGKPHRFLDTSNILLTAIEAGALTVDGISTQRTLKTVPGTYEADPIARPFVNRGWPGQIAGGVLFIGADVGLRYLLHRKGHHRLERWLPMILTADGTLGAVDNFHQLAGNHGPTPGR